MEPVREEVRRGGSSGTSGLSGAATYDREKKPEEEPAVEPVDCQEHRQHTPREEARRGVSSRTSERRSQTRSQQWNQWTVRSTVNTHREKKPDEESAAEPVDCEPRQQPRCQNAGEYDVSMCRETMCQCAGDTMSMCRTDRKCTHGDAPEKQGRRACDAARRKREPTGCSAECADGPMHQCKDGPTQQ